MAAVSTLVDRIYRDFLNKPDDLAAFSRLDGAMTDSDTSLTNAPASNKFSSSTLNKPSS